MSPTDGGWGGRTPWTENVESTSHPSSRVYPSTLRSAGQTTHETLPHSYFTGQLSFENFINIERYEVRES